MSPLRKWLPLALVLVACHSEPAPTSRAFSPPVGIQVEPTSGAPGYQIVLAVTKPSVPPDLIQPFMNLIAPAVKKCGVHDGSLRLDLVVANGRLDQRPGSEANPSESCVVGALRGQRFGTEGDNFGLRAQIDLSAPDAGAAKGSP